MTYSISHKLSISVALFDDYIQRNQIWKNFNFLHLKYSYKISHLSYSQGNQGKQIMSLIFLACHYIH